MSLSPIVSRSGVAKNKVFRVEKCPVDAGSNSIDRTWLQVDEYRPGYVPLVRGLIVINVDAVKLEIDVTNVPTSFIDTVFR